VARRAAAIKREYEKDNSVLLLSAGDFYGESSILAMYRGRFLSDMMIKMGYCAVGVGEHEINYQLKAIREDIEKGLPVICSNLYDDRKCVFPPYLIKEIHGNRVGIFALLDEPVPQGLNMELKSPSERGREVINDLRGKGCELIILIAHMGTEKLKDIMPSLRGVDLIIRGHADGGAQIQPDCINGEIEGSDNYDIPVLFAGDGGRKIGKIVVVPNGAEEYDFKNSTVISLKKSSARDQRFVEYLRDYREKEVERLRELRMKKFTSHDNSGKLRERYLGVDICARCHGDIVSAFRSSAHSKAYDRLKDTYDKTRCLECHTTGYGTYSGYGSDEAGKNRINLEGVTCEACHGYGTNHSRDNKYVRSAVNSCGMCHTPSRSPDFEYEEYLRRVLCYMKPDSSTYKKDYK